MNKKQFALIILIWALVMATIFATPARGGNVPMVTTNQPLVCDDSIRYQAAARVRVTQLTEMLSGTTNPHARLVLEVEREAVAILEKKIVMWRNESCKDA